MVQYSTYNTVQCGVRELSVPQCREVWVAPDSGMVSLVSPQTQLDGVIDQVVFYQVVVHRVVYHRVFGRCNLVPIDC